MPFRSRCVNVSTFSQTRRKENIYTSNGIKQTAVIFVSLYLPTEKINIFFPLFLSNFKSQPVVYWFK